MSSKHDDSALTSETNSNNTPHIDSPKDEEKQVQPQMTDSQPNAKSEESAPATAPVTPSPPPNGGLLAWTQVLCGFLLFFNTFGIITTYGVYQSYYESSASSFQQTSSNISWIGSIQAFLLQFSGFIAGPVFDKGYFRQLIMVGAFGIVFGHMMLSLSTTYWQCLLSQAFVVGLGMGALYVPSVSILPQYFSTRLGTAIGLASAGSSIGGLLYPIILRSLIDSVGFGWAVRVVGFVALGTLSIPVVLMKPRLQPAKARSIIDWSAFTDLPFMWFAAATCIGFMGVTAFQIYFAFYAVQQGLVDPGFDFYLVSIYCGLSVLGRIVPNALSDKAGLFNVLAPSVIFTAAIYYSMIGVHARGPMIGLSILGGFCLGVLTALPPVCFAMLTKDKSRLGTRLGTGFAINSFGVLVAGPIAGAIVQSSADYNWVGVWIYAGTTSLASGIMYLALRVYRSGFNPFIKA